MRDVPPVVGVPATEFTEASVQEVAALLEAARIPGCTLLQVDDIGTTRGMSLGFADVARTQAMSINTVSRLYSGTKVVTAAAVMKLVERNLVSLETDIREVLPNLPLKHTITVEQLASHTSGLSDTLRAFVAIHYPNEDQPSTGDALARFELSKGKLPGPPARYRNVNFALLAEIIARVAGTSYEEFVRTEFLQPWKSSADFSVSAFPEGSMATGYLRRFDPIRLVAPWLLGARGRTLFGDRESHWVPLVPFDLDCAGIGGLVGSVADFAPILVEFLSKSDGVLLATSKRQMLQKHAKGKLGVVSDRGVGLAWKLGNSHGIDFWNHEGGGPGYCSEIRLYPDQRIGFVVLFNLSQSRVLSRTAHNICELLRKKKN